MALTNFTIIEAGSVVVSVLGGLAMLCGVISKSRCDKVSLCCGLVNCHRKVPEQPPPPDVETGRITAPVATDAQLKRW